MRLESSLTPSTVSFEPDLCIDSLQQRRRLYLRAVKKSSFLNVLCATSGKNLCLIRVSCAATQDSRIFLSRFCSCGHSAITIEYNAESLTVQS